MERRIDINLIIWLVFLLLLFGGSLIKWLIRRFSKGTALGQDEGEGREEAASQERPSTLMEEFKKMFEGMVLEERPEIVVVEERYPKRRQKHLRRIPKETAPTPQPVPKPALGRGEGEERLPAVSEVTPPAPKALSSKVLSRNELQKAVVLSEILGPPRARRRHYRLF
jgi:hypothetical protein